MKIFKIEFFGKPIIRPIEMLQNVQKLAKVDYHSYDHIYDITGSTYFSCEKKVNATP